MFVGWLIGIVLPVGWLIGVGMMLFVGWLIGIEVAGLIGVDGAIGLG